MGVRRDVHREKAVANSYTGASIWGKALEKEDAWASMWRAENQPVLGRG